VALLVLASVLLCSVMGVVIGARLLALARRTREAPELLVGTGLVVYSGLALPLLLVRGAGLPPAAAYAALGVGQAANVVTVGAILAFTWRVFRPRAPLARALAAAGTASAAIGAGGIVVAFLAASSAAEGGPSARPFVALLIVTWAGAFLWTGVESLRYHAMLRRRLALGLADPVVSNRVLLWAIWGITGFALDLLNLGYSLAGLDFSRHPAPLLTICASSLASSAVWYLAFFAPERYLRLVSRRAPFGG
jgi:hypothetical protein